MSEKQQEEATEQKPQHTMKERVELQRGRNVPIDYFLFTCLEHERTQRATAAAAGEGADEVVLNKGRWPIMVGATLETLPGELKSMDLKGLMGRMSLWYAAQYPEMVEETPLDHIMLNNIVEPFMKFTLDLADLVLLKTGTALPAHNAETDESKEVWATISVVLKEEFPGYYAYFDRVLRWAFADVEPEEIEEGSRPPVGKNMPNFRGNRQPQGGGPQHRGQHGGGGGGGGHRGQQGGGHRGQHGGGQHGGRGDRSNHRGGDGQRGRHQGGGHNGRHGGGGGGHNQQADAETEKLALASVDDAMAKITSGEVEEVFLKPMNSFYRRIQHQYEVDKGFESCSVGEGNERGVKVSKKL